MKTKIHFLFYAFILSASFNLYAQTTYKGRMFVGGNLSISGGSTSSLDSIGKPGKGSGYVFTVNPNYGVFLSKSFAIGLSLGYSNYYYKSESNSVGSNPSNFSYTNSSYNYNAAAFCRYYKFIGEKFAFIVTCKAGYSYGKGNSMSTNINQTNTSTSESKNTNQNYSASLAPGVVYFISPKFGLEASFGNLSYNYGITKDDTKNYDNYTHNSNYGLNLGLSTLQFGVNYYFGKNKTVQ